jgi:hypothetical protein
MQLSDYIDKTVIMASKMLGGTREVKVLGVDAGGVWIECQEATNQLLGQFNVPSSPTTFVFFLPYGEVQMISVPISKVGLNEKAFGV